MMKVNGIKYDFSQKELYWTIVGANEDIRFTSAIPERLDGYPVLAIGDKAFYEVKSLTGIILPRSINQIGKEAFAGCTKLQYVSFERKSSANLNIGVRAFHGCCDLKRFQATDRIAFVQAQAFAGCNNLHYINCKIKTIAHHSFTECSNLDAIIFANKAKISSRSIQNCTVKHIAFEGDAIIADTEAFLKMFSESNVFATENFSYWDLVYGGLNIAPR